MQPYYAHYLGVIEEHGDSSGGGGGYAGVHRRCAWGVCMGGVGVCIGGRFGEHGKVRAHDAGVVEEHGDWSGGGGGGGHGFVGCRSVSEVHFDRVHLWGR